MNRIPTHLPYAATIVALLVACSPNTESDGSSQTDAASRDASDATSHTDVSLADVDITGSWYMMRFNHTESTTTVPRPADLATTRFEQDGDEFTQFLQDADGEFAIPGTVSGSTYTQTDGNFVATIELRTPNAAVGRFEMGAFTMDFELVRQVAPSFAVGGEWQEQGGSGDTYSFNVTGNDVTIVGAESFRGWIAADRALLLADPQPENGSAAALVRFAGSDSAQMTIYRTSWTPDGGGHRDYTSSEATISLGRGDEPGDCAALNRTPGSGSDCGACVAGHSTHLDGTDSICCPGGQISNPAGTACLPCPVPPGGTSSCGDNGACAPSEDGESAVCTCDAGWHGPLCDEVDDCDGVVCENGGTCLDIGDSYLCRCPPGVEGQACETVCESERLPIPSCGSSRSLSPEACLSLIDDNLNTGLQLDCTVSGNGYCDYTGDCSGGCVDEVVVIADYIDETYAMTEVWIHTDWWTKRPLEWEVFAGPSYDELGRGLRSRSSGEMREAPWRCEAGEECARDVPDACCPDGRDQPQRVDSEAPPIARWDVFPLEPEVGSAWALRVIGSQEGRLVDLNEFAFYGNGCSVDRSCPDGMVLGADDRCEDVDGCASNPCAAGEICIDRLAPDTGHDCLAPEPVDPTSCDRSPCFDGVECTDREGETPDFACGPCPDGFSGDGVDCTRVGTPCDSDPCHDGVECTNREGETPDFECGECPDGLSGDGITCTAEPPEVVSTVPEAGVTARLSDTGFEPGSVNRFIVQFDRNVSAAGVTAVAVQLGGDFSAVLEPRRPTSRDFTKLELWPDEPSRLTSYPGGEYEVTIENVRASAVGAPGGLLESYSWRFSVTGCGDGTCQAAESSCTCSADCGTCDGCCEYTGGSPSSVCRAGTTNSRCGRGGESCGVCTEGDCEAGRCR